MDERRYNNSETRNKNFKRKSFNSWNEDYEPHYRRPRYQENSTYHHAYYQNKSRYFSDHRIFNNRNNNRGYDSRVNRNTHIPNQRNKYFENNIFVIDGNLHEKNKINSSDNHVNDQYVEHDSSTCTEKNPSYQNSEQTNQETKIVQLSITRNLNLQDPRTKLSCIRCNKGDTFYYKIFDRKIYSQNGQQNIR